MKTSMKRLGGVVRVTAAVLALATAFGGLAVTSAQANDHDRGRGHYDHRHYRDHGRGYYYEQPQGYYAPPPVEVYSPPPPSPGINFVFPLHIR